MGTFATKLNVYHPFVSVATYMVANVDVSQACLRLDCFHMICLHTIAGIRWQDLVLTEFEVLSICNMNDIEII